MKFSDLNLHNLNNNKISHLSNLWLISYFPSIYEDYLHYSKELGLQSLCLTSFQEYCSVKGKASCQLLFKHAWKVMPTSWSQFLQRNKQRSSVMTLYLLHLYCCAKVPSPRQLIRSKGLFRLTFPDTITEWRLILLRPRRRQMHALKMFWVSETSNHVLGKVLASLRPHFFFFA